VLAWALGHWLDISLRERLHLTPWAVGLGLAAALPLLLGLRWTITTPISPVRRLVKLVVEQLGPVLARRSAAELALLATLAGLAEEVLFRGVVQVGLTRVLPEGGAVIVASAVFGLAHFLTPTYAALAALAGLYLGALFLLQGNLMVPIVAHALYDFVALLYLVRRYRSLQD
jgi:uncharacterized protein